MCWLARYFVVLAMIFTYHGQEVNAGPAPDPCLFGKRFRRPTVEETIAVDGRKENILQLETPPGSLEPTIAESSKPEILNNGQPRTITGVNNFVKSYIQFLTTLLNSF